MAAPMLHDPDFDRQLQRWRELERLLEDAQRLLLARDWRAFLQAVAQLSALGETIERTIAKPAARGEDWDRVLARVAGRARVLRALLARTCRSAQISSNLLACVVGTYPARTGE